MGTKVNGNVIITGGVSEIVIGYYKVQDFADIAAWKTQVRRSMNGTMRDQFHAEFNTFDITVIETENIHDDQSGLEIVKVTFHVSGIVNTSHQILLDSWSIITPAEIQSSRKG